MLSPPTIPIEVPKQSNVGKEVKELLDQSACSVRPLPTKHGEKGEVMADGINYSPIEEPKVQSKVQDNYIDLSPMGSGTVVVPLQFVPISSDDMKIFQS